MLHGNVLDNVVFEHGVLPHVFYLAVKPDFLCLWVEVGGLQHFIVSPSPLGAKWVIEFIGTWTWLG